MTRVLFLVGLVLAAVAPAAGCGGEDAEPAPEPTVITAGQVTREFRQEAGEDLEQAAGADPAWQQFNFGLNPPRELVKRYGIFSVYVVEAGNEAAIDSLLADKTTGDPLPADGDGIRWEKDELSGTWIAYRRYADNVVLTWFSERTTQSVDERFRRLDEILSSLAANA